MANCPKCNQPVTRVKWSRVEIDAGKDRWRANAYSCVSCETIITIEMDPLTVMCDTIRGVTKALEPR